MHHNEYHHKPRGHKGPCPICGCPAKGLRARHRLRDDGRWEKLIMVCFGGDWMTKIYATDEWRD
jgi:hypothetical protein